MCRNCIQHPYMILKNFILWKTTWSNICDVSISANLDENHWKQWKGWKVETMKGEVCSLETLIKKLLQKVLLEKAMALKLSITNQVVKNSAKSMA